MRRNNKKGFTIVELVIVIAVIAILAAVLIPTFSGIVTKAKENAALQEAKNEYTNIYALALSDNGIIDEKDDFDANGNKVIEGTGSGEVPNPAIKATKVDTTYTIETAEYKFTFTNGVLTGAVGIENTEAANFTYDVVDGVIKSAKTIK